MRAPPPTSNDSVDMLQPNSPAEGRLHFVAAVPSLCAAEAPGSADRTPGYIMDNGASVSFDLQSPHKTAY